MKKLLKSLIILYLVFATPIWFEGCTKSAYAPSVLNEIGTTPIVSDTQPTVEYHKTIRLTDTPTPEPTEAPTSTPTPEPTNTPIPTNTPTPEPTEAPIPTVEPTDAPTPTKTPVKREQGTYGGLFIPSLDYYVPVNFGADLTLPDAWSIYNYDYVQYLIDKPNSAAIEFWNNDNGHRYGIIFDHNNQGFSCIYDMIIGETFILTNGYKEDWYEVVMVDRFGYEHPDWTWDYDLVLQTCNPSHYPSITCVYAKYIGEVLD